MNSFFITLFLSNLSNSSKKTIISSNIETFLNEDIDLFTYRGSDFKRNSFVKEKDKSKLRKQTNDTNEDVHTEDF